MPNLKFLAQIDMHAPVADAKNVATKEYVDAQVAAKADAAATDLSGHVANKSNPHSVTCAQIGAAALASPTFTGTPKAPTAAAGTNTTQLATTAFVQAAVGAVGTPKMYTATVTGTGTATTFTVTHNLNTKNVQVQTYDASGNEVMFGKVVTTVNALQLTAAAAPATTETFTVVVMGIPA